MSFYTESMSDLAPQLPNIIYFRSYLSATATQAEETWDILEAVLYAYDPLLPAMAPEVVQANVTSVQNGYGILNEIIYDDAKIYYIELTLDNYAPSEATYLASETQPYPISSMITF